MLTSVSLRAAFKGVGDTWSSQRRLWRHSSHLTYPKGCHTDLRMALFCDAARCRTSGSEPVHFNSSEGSHSVSLGLVMQLVDS